MRETVSVDKAIKRGHLIVNLPVMVCIIGCPAFAFYLSSQDLIPKWVIAIAFVIGIGLAWLVWSFMITKWRIWAFENVRNVHELKKRAIQEKLIWNDGNIFEKTEIRSHDDRQKLKKLEKKFEKADEYREDHSLPPRTVLSYSKSKSYIELAFSTLAMVVGVYFILEGEKKGFFLGIIAGLIALFSAIKELRKIINNKPQIVIDNKGIKTKNIDFKNWSVIENEEVFKEGYGKSAKSYLIFFYDNNAFEKIEIDTLNVTHKKLENMLRTYRLRYNKSQKLNLNKQN